MKVNILGTEYSIELLTKAQDEYLKQVDGYCDKTSKRIVVRAQEDDKKDVSVIDNYDVYLRTMLRHEVIHAFLFESGLHNNFSHPEWGHDETMIDWIAVQFPKIQEVMEQIYKHLSAMK